MRLLITFVFSTFLFLPAQAADVSPYAGEETRPIKSLSSDEQTSLLAGKGMGFAKAAELNGYPGPAHVLELDKELELTDEQRAKTVSLFNKMESDARSLGAKLIASEQSLDELFSSRKITVDSLNRTTNEIGQIKAELRAIHLKAHLEQTKILSSHQIHLYNKIRGYASGGHKGHGHHHHH